MEEEIIKLPKLKVNPKKLPLLLFLISIIFCATLYIVLHPTTKITTLLYRDNCTEVYVNDILNGSMCPLNIYNKQIDNSAVTFNFSKVNKSHE